MLDAGYTLNVQSRTIHRLKENLANWCCWPCYWSLILGHQTHVPQHIRPPAFQPSTPPTCHLNVCLEDEHLQHPVHQEGMELDARHLCCSVARQPTACVALCTSGWW